VLSHRWHTHIPSGSVPLSISQATHVACTALRVPSVLLPTRNRPYPSALLHAFHSQHSLGPRRSTFDQNLSANVCFKQHLRICTGKRATDLVPELLAERQQDAQFPLVHAVALGELADVVPLDASLANHLGQAFMRGSSQVCSFAPLVDDQRSAPD
jgi:hypothetical protein